MVRSLVFVLFCVGLCILIPSLSYEVCGRGLERTPEQQAIWDQVEAELGSNADFDRKWALYQKRDQARLDKEHEKKGLEEFLEKQTRSNSAEIIGWRKKECTRLKKLDATLDKYQGCKYLNKDFSLPEWFLKKRLYSFQNGNAALYENPLDNKYWSIITLEAERERPTPDRYYAPAYPTYTSAQYAPGYGPSGYIGQGNNGNGNININTDNRHVSDNNIDNSQRNQIRNQNAVNGNNNRIDNSYHSQTTTTTTTNTNSGNVVNKFCLFGCTQEAEIDEANNENEIDEAEPIESGDLSDNLSEAELDDVWSNFDQQFNNNHISDNNINNGQYNQITNQNIIQGNKNSITNTYNSQTTTNTNTNTNSNNSRNYINIFGSRNSNQAQIDDAIIQTEQQQQKLEVADPKVIVHPRHKFHHRKYNKPIKVSVTLSV